ncbi:thiopeptide-type bacteriocin biosynthesis protein [Microtetraspora sp. AC03309]|uniref:thiopeptide-type bacteriocin biosynthesis protein n=1 Tax=Microtetraspora sp. AC03309 TaxID=2779376 RepID=UPI001E5004F4|nr:thiopeptide-type bacteriocin biosynthesis protein [Microtetraspora sp. AC03309]MCC5579622.1 thiopeptide-type bacteriocin biosynthesis protein [Microtetraspora sp. AC03309]
MRPERDWISAHAFYQGDLDRLLVDLIDPLITELVADGLVEQWFFLRYWDGGPHVRVRVLPTPGRARSDIEGLLTARFDTYVRVHPSSERIGQADYGRLARALAEWEGLSSYSPRLWPTDTLGFVPYRREHRRYGDGASMEAVERHFTESSAIAMSVLRREASPARRATAAFAMILLAWFACRPDPADVAEFAVPAFGRAGGGRGGTDVRAFVQAGHAEAVAKPEETEAFVQARDAAAFVRASGLGEAGETRAAGTLGEVGWRPDAAFEARRGPLLSLARDMARLARHAPELADGGSLASWSRSVRTLTDVLEAQIAARAFVPPERGWEGSGEVTAEIPRVRAVAVTDICAHLVCNRLGVSPAEEAAVRGMAARAVAALAGETGAAERTEPAEEAGFAGRSELAGETGSAGMTERAVDVELSVGDAAVRGDGVPR